MLFDRLGNDLNIGDTVAFVTISYKRANLRIGVIISKENHKIKLSYIAGSNKKTIIKDYSEVVLIQKPKYQEYLLS
jgi:hypothetical protein